MSREKKILGHVTGDFFTDSKKIAYQYVKEIKMKKKEIKKTDFLIIFVFLILFSILISDLIFSYRNMKIFIYGAVAVIGITLLLISKSIKKQ